MQFRSLRKQKGFTQEYIATMLGIGQPTVAMWETGKTRPSMRNLMKLAALFETDVEKIYRLFCENEKSSPVEGESEENLQNVKSSARGLKSLQEFRRSKGITQGDMARLMGITLSMYEKVEEGRAGASAAFMRRLKKAFPEVNIDALFFAA